MNKSILILGGYGTFGYIISSNLSQHYQIIIGGRDPKKAEIAAKELSQNATFPVKTRCFDVRNIQKKDLDGIDLVINTCGPFQNQDFTVPKVCIASKTHYIDLADANDFVSNIHTLDLSSKQNGVCIISGASTIPSLSSAVIDHYLGYFTQLESIKYGISPGQKTPRGLATTKGILSYLGKISHNRYGWQGLYFEKYPIIGYRPMGYCDVPDLSLFPKKYSVDSIQFSAGMENHALHLSIWLTSWLVRLGLPINLVKYSKQLLRLSHCFDFFGSDAGGMHMHLKGYDKNNNPLQITWYLIAKDGHGPQIPSIPAIILTHKIFQNPKALMGAQPAISLINLNEYLSQLKNFNIKTFENINNHHTNT